VSNGTLMAHGPALLDGFGLANELTAPCTGCRQSTTSGSDARPPGVEHGGEGWRVATGGGAHPAELRAVPVDPHYPGALVRGLPVVGLREHRFGDRRQVTVRAQRDAPRNRRERDSLRRDRRGRAPAPGPPSRPSLSPARAARSVIPGRPTRAPGRTMSYLSSQESAGGPHAPPRASPGQRRRR
jgi:hypothetical protein